MITGLTFNRILPEEKALSQQAYAVTQNILKEFTEHFGTVNCNDLVGYNLQEQYEEFIKDKEARQKCHDYVEYAVKSLVRELEKSKNES